MFGLFVFCWNAYGKSRQRFLEAIACMTLKLVADIELKTGSQSMPIVYQETFKYY